MVDGCCAGQFTFPLHVPLSDGVRDLLSKMIEVDPVKRASIADIQVITGIADRARAATRGNSGDMGSGGRL